MGLGNKLAASAVGVSPATGVDEGSLAVTVRTDTAIDANAADVWSAVRGVYRVHELLAPGLVVSVERDGDTRKVTFANGFVVNEKILTIDDAGKRIVYSAFGGRATYHMASMQVVSDGAGSRVIWTTDFLPADLGPVIVGNMEHGSTVIKQTLEARATRG